MSPLERDLESRLHETQAILDSFKSPIASINSSFHIVHLNSPALKFTGMPSMEAATGRPCYKLLYNRDGVCPYCPFQNQIGQNQVDREQDPGHHLDVEKSRTPVEAAEEDPAGSQERIIQVREGDIEKTYRVWFQTIEEGPHTRIIETIEDITDQRREQEEHLRMEKLAAIGTMISGVAHELNNPLTGMELNLQNLVANVPTMDVQEVSRRLLIIRKDLTRAARVVNDILSFARTEKLQLSRGDIYNVVQRARENITRLYPVLSRKVEWRLDTPTQRSFYFNPAKMERLFINLFKNSIQAMDYHSGYIRVDLSKQGESFHIMVEDDAGGIPEQNLGEIFNPFYTNSRDGKGTGLGLSICHSIVDEHNGSISVESRDGTTKFKIVLPTHTPIMSERE